MATYDKNDKFYEFDRALQTDTYSDYADSDSGTGLGPRSLLLRMVWGGSHRAWSAQHSAYAYFGLGCS